MKWVKIFAEHIFDKDSISKIHKELITQRQKQITQLKMGKGFEYSFLQRRNIND